MKLKATNLDDGFGEIGSPFLVVDESEHRSGIDIRDIGFVELSNDFVDVVQQKSGTIVVTVEQIHYVYKHYGYISNNNNTLSE